jgi:PAS domain S-box-containing protein
MILCNDINKMVDIRGLNKEQLIERIKTLEELLGQFQGEGNYSKFIEEYEDKKIESEIRKKELEETQKLLEESVHLYSDLFDYAPAGYISLDEKGLISNINLTAAELLGSYREHLKGIPFSSFIVKFDLSRYLRMISRSKKEGDTITEEFRINTKNRGVVDVEIICTRIYDYSERKVFHRIALVDISERIKAQKALRESEDRFRIMADAAPVFIWVFDVHNNLEYVNKKLLDFQNKSFTSLKEEKWWGDIHPEDQPLFLKKFYKEIDDLKEFTHEFRIRTYDKSFKWVYFTAIPRLSDNQIFSGYICSGVDITETKESRDALEKSLTEKVILIKEVHHRVKNNLQIISSLLNLQATSKLNKSVEEILKDSQSRIYSIALLHEKLYNSEDFSNIDHKEYLRSLINNLLVTFRGVSGRISIFYDIADIKLNINTLLLLGMIISELISNSLKHAYPEGTEGEIKIALKTDVNKKIISLEVADNGIGLPENIQPKKQDTLGLMLVHSLGDQLGADINISNNGGTKFSFIFRNTADHSKAVSSYT